MTRAEYHALRRAAWTARAAYDCEAAEDGRSSYASHGIRCDHALRAWQQARAAVPRDRGESLETARRLNRRRRVLFCIHQRNQARRHTPSCVSAYTRDVRAALIPLEVCHVRIGAR